MAASTHGGGTKGEFGHDYTIIVNALERLRGQRPVYIPNPGNAGDSLISANAYQIFEDMGLDVETGYHKFDYPDRHLIYAGGGNLVSYYDEARTFIERHAATLRSFVMLPHTVRGNDALLGSLDERFTIFARERKTHEYLTAACAGGARIELGHDMAFYADPRRLRRSALAGLARDLAAPRTLRHDLRQIRNWRKTMADRRSALAAYPPEGPVLNAFRIDVESAGKEVPPGNLDVSEHFMHLRDQGPFMSRQVVGAMIGLISRYETIRTDRLHMAVLATLLGKRVEARDNVYGKLGLIHEASMQEFDNVRFVEA